MTERQGRERMRLAMFQRGAAAWARVSGSRNGLYVCPICTRLFAIDALQSGRLTLEHVPPASVFGRPLVLTCAQCNSGAGHTVDADLHRRQELRNLERAMVEQRPGSSGAARFDVNGTELNVLYRTGSDGLTVDVRGAMNNPTRFEEQRGKLEAMARGGPIRFTFTPVIRVSQRYVQISELRAAYLAAFAVYGYRYALHPDLNPVRAQVRDPNSRIIHGAWLYHAEAQPWLIARVTSPVVAVYATFDRTTVVLPWPGAEPAPGPKLVELWEAARQGGADSLELNGKARPWPGRMELGLDFM